MVPSSSRTESLRRRGDSTHVALGPRWREHKGQQHAAKTYNDRVTIPSVNEFGLISCRERLVGYRVLTLQQYASIGGYADT